MPSCSPGADARCAVSSSEFRVPGLVFLAPGPLAPGPLAPGPLALMRAAKLMRAAHQRHFTRLSRVGNHSPESTPSRFPNPACARHRRKTVAPFHKGVQGPCRLMRAANLMRGGRGKEIRRVSEGRRRRFYRIAKNQLRAAANLPKRQAAARLADQVQSVFRKSILYTTTLWKSVPSVSDSLVVTINSAAHRLDVRRSLAQEPPPPRFLFDSFHR